MASLVKCPLCGRQVSSKCNSCPGCGHNVAHELVQREVKRGDDLLKQNICPKCNNRNWTTYLFSTPADWERKIGMSNQYSRKCSKCGWKDFHWRQYGEGGIPSPGHYSYTQAQEMLSS